MRRIEKWVLRFVISREGLYEEIPCLKETKKDAPKKTLIRKGQIFRRPRKKARILLFWGNEEEDGEEDCRIQQGFGFGFD